MVERRRGGSLLWFAGAFVVVAFLSLWVGRYPMSLGEVAQVLLAKVGLLRPLEASRGEIILMNVRLPRVLLAAMVGCCLSAAGANYQGIFQNPMASPDILGASAGASFGAALGILLRLSHFMVTALAFLFSLLSVALVWLISRRARGKQVLGLVLSGIMVGSLLSALTSFIKLVADPSDQLPAITYWLMGSLSAARLSHVAFAALPMALGLVPLLLLRWRVNLLTMGDEEAAAMGVNTKALRLTVIISSTLMTATAVAVSGTIGWIGLVVPHLSRRVVGNDYRYLTPLSMVFGALFLLIVDDLARSLFTTEIPLGIITALVGAPFFLGLITKGGEGP